MAAQSEIDNDLLVKVTAENFLGGIQVAVVRQDGFTSESRYFSNPMTAADWASSRSLPIHAKADCEIIEAIEFYREAYPMNIISLTVEA